MFTWHRFERHLMLRAPSTSTHSTSRLPRRHMLRWLASMAAIAAGPLLLWQASSAAPGEAVPLAPPLQDVSAGPSHKEKAIFAGGCFWGVQGVYQHLRGVQRVVSGYSGGNANTATYPAVGRGDTGHAESVEITYDPAQVSYGTLLQVFFSVAHNPTELNRQGPDTGTQYRSAIWATNADQYRVAKAYIAQLDKAKSFKAPIVTGLENGSSFFAAEAYHQDFMAEQPNHPYIAVHDAPKVAQLQRLFPTLYRAEPVLVKKTS